MAFTSIVVPWREDEDATGGDGVKQAVGGSRCKKCNN